MYIINCDMRKLGINIPDLIYPKNVAKFETDRFIDMCELK